METKQTQQAQNQPKTNLLRKDDSKVRPKWTIFVETECELAL